MIAAEADRRSEFEALLGPVLDVAWRTAVHFTRDASEADDLVQEAALAALKGFDTFEPGTRFRPWFLKVLTNCFYQKCRREKRRGEEIELEEAPPLYLFCRTASLGLHEQDDPASTLMRQLTQETIMDAIHALPEEYRLVSTLYFVQDAPYQEIAAELGIPVGTVRSRLHRARRQLQKVLWELAEERGLVSALGAGEQP